MTINEKIKMLRELNHLTQENMAEKLALSTNGYAKMERGETGIQVERLVQIANIFGVEPSDLIALNEKNVIYYTAGENNTNHDGFAFNFIQSTDDDGLVYELSKAKMTINHQAEIIDRQQQEINTLKKALDLLAGK